MRIYYAFVFILIFSFSGLLKAQTIFNINIFDYCPWTCVEKGKMSGVMVDVLRAVCTKSTRYTCNMKIVPYARSLDMLLQGENVISSDADVDIPIETIFHARPYTLIGQYHFTLANYKKIVNENTVIQLASDDDSFIMGMINGYQYSGKIEILKRAYKDSVFYSSNTEGYVRLIKILKNGRITSVLVDSPIIFDYYVSKLKLDRNNFKLSDVDSAKFKSFFAFSKKAKDKKIMGHFLKDLDKFMTNKKETLIIDKKYKGKFFQKL